MSEQAQWTDNRIVAYMEDAGVYLDSYIGEKAFAVCRQIRDDLQQRIAQLESVERMLRTELDTKDRGLDAHKRLIATLQAELASILEAKAALNKTSLKHSTKFCAEETTPTKRWPCTWRFTEARIVVATDKQIATLQAELDEARRQGEWVEAEDGRYETESSIVVGVHGAILNYYFGGPFVASARLPDNLRLFCRRTTGAGEADNGE